MKNRKLTLSWILAILITLIAVYYQRVTGPTYPRTEKFKINGLTYKIKLPRSAVADKDTAVVLVTEHWSLGGKVFYRRYNSDEKDTFCELHFAKDINGFDEKKAEIMGQPVAGKIQYYLQFYDGKDTIFVAKDHPVVMRFRNDVPWWILTPHIILVFFALLLSNLTGLMIIFKLKRYKISMWLSVIFLFAGGIVYGMIVQKIAFGQYWMGFPYGKDLTDNKLLIGFIAWLVAALLNIKKDRPRWALFAAILLIVVYSIPHSLFGSQFNYKTGKIITG